MLKKFFALCLAIYGSAFCLDTPEAGVTYKITGETFVKAPDRFQKGDKIEKISDQKIDLGIFALCYKNYQNNFNQDYLESVFGSISRLDSKVSTCVTLVIDDDKAEVLAEIKDIIRVCNQLPRRDIPVYINWNGGNLKIRKSRDNLLELVQLFGTKYIFLADSDDILHPDCIPIMYQTMERNENLYLLLGEYTLLGYLNNRPQDIEPYRNKELNADNFELKFFFENSHHDNKWFPIENKLLVAKRIPSLPSKGSGYLPAMIRYFDQIPTECCRRDGSMLVWFVNTIGVLEGTDPNSEGNHTDDVRKDTNIKDDSQCAILTPLDGEFFLYFYRLYGQSNSHRIIEGANQNPRILGYFMQTICWLHKKIYSSEDIIGILIKEVCPQQSLIDDGINNFKLQNELRLIQSHVSEDNVDFVNEGVRSFWRMIQELCNGNIVETKNWIEQFSNEGRWTTAFGKLII